MHETKLLFLSCSTELRRFFALLIVFCLFIHLKVSGQCSPFVKIGGEICVGSLLSAKTNVSGFSIVWKRSGTAFNTQPLFISREGVTIVGLNGAGSGPDQVLNPNRIFIDKKGDLYIPDMSNNRIQKWTPGATSGVTVAGGHGTGSAADQFNRPTSVYVDDAGNIYVTDQYNNRIQKWKPGATSGVTVVEYVDLPTGVYLDSKRDIYVSEQGSSLVSKWKEGSSSKTVVAGGNGYGTAANQFSSPTGIFVDAQGNLYVCDTDNNRIQKWAPGAASGLTVAGSGYAGFSASELFYPLGIYVDGNGNIYISDFNNHRVQKWSPGATSGVTVAGGNGAGSANNQIARPAGIAMDAECNLYVADFENHRVQRFNMAVTAQVVATEPGDYSASVTTLDGTVFTSNKITVLPSVLPTIKVVADKSAICPGEKLAFQAIITDGGNNPGFQWLKNGVAVGENTDHYSDDKFVEGDQVSCVLTSNASCVVARTVSSDPVNVHVLKPHVPVSLGQDVDLCDGKSITLAPPTSYLSYLWQDGSKGTSINIDKAGIYSVTVTDACGKSTDSVVVSILPLPEKFLSADTAFCKDESVFVTAPANYKDYLWSTGETSISIEVKQGGTYWLRVTAQNNCAGVDSIVIVAKDCNRKLYVPNAFTPNNDGRNDRLKPIFSGNVKSFHFFVYNRWGQLVYETTSLSTAWDGKVGGKPQSAETFVWLCKYQFFGESLVTEKGTVSIVN